MSASGGLPLPEEVRDPDGETATNGNLLPELGSLPEHKSAPDLKTNAASGQSNPKLGKNDSSPADSNKAPEQTNIPEQGILTEREDVISKNCG